MQIGNISIQDPVLTLAPLAGYGDVAFRRLCRESGASLTVTEMVSCKGLVYGNEKTTFLLRTSPAERPSCVQLFGSDPDSFYKAVSLPELQAFDIVDINMGCPVPKITKCGEGGALLRDSQRAADIVRACVAASGGRPVTAKMRIGYGENERCGVSFAGALQEAGVCALTVHGRTVAQGYAGRADWDEIARIARAVSVPVLGNGDIVSREQAIRAMRDYGMAGVAIGRGAVGNPAVFAENNSQPLHEIMLRHLAYALQYFPERVAVTSLRKHFCHYLAGRSGTKALRLALTSACSADEIRKLIEDNIQILT